MVDCGTLPSVVLPSACSACIACGTSNAGLFIRDFIGFSFRARCTGPAWFYRDDGCARGNVTDGADRAELIGGNVLEIGEHPLDERVPGREEVDRLIFHGFLAIEGADIRGSTRHAWQAVDEGLAAELDGEDLAAAQVLDAKPEARAGAGDDALGQRVKVRRHAREDHR